MAAPVIDLSPRLSAIASRVIANRPMADIGTDHALLPGWLVMRGDVPSAIGIDVKPAPLRAAAAIADAIAGVELRLGDGMQPLRDDEVATVVIAGMGGARIRRIVDAGVPASVQRLILQPNTEWAATRAWIAARGFALDDEAIVADRGKFYVLLVVRPQPGACTYAWTDIDLELGPILRTRADPTWRAWVTATRDELRRAVTSAQAGDRDDPQRQRATARLTIFESASRRREYTAQP